MIHHEHWANTTWYHDKQKTIQDSRQQYTRNRHGSVGDHLYNNGRQKGRVAISRNEMDHKKIISKELFIQIIVLATGTPDGLLNCQIATGLISYFIRLLWYSISLNGLLCHLISKLYQDLLVIPYQS